MEGRTQRFCLHFVPQGEPKAAHEGRARTDRLDDRASFPYDQKPLVVENTRGNLQPEEVEPLHVFIRKGPDEVTGFYSRNNRRFRPTFAS